MQCSADMQRVITHNNISQHSHPSIACVFALCLTASIVTILVLKSTDTDSIGTPQH